VRRAAARRTSAGGCRCVRRADAAALEHAGLTGEFERFARLVHQHEKAHLEALRKALGNAAIKRPTFAFGSAVTSKASFTAPSIALEDTGVQSYQGPAPAAFNPALTKSAVLAAVGATGFIQ
jgi:hypothetical protein